MSFKKGIVLSETFTAASAMGMGVPVFQPLASSRDGVVVPAGSLNQDLLGLTLASVGSYGEEVNVVLQGITKAIAGASLGAGARLTVGSVNGVLIPITLNGVASSVGATQPPRYQVARSMHSAVALDVIAVIVDPAEVI